MLISRNVRPAKDRSILRRTLHANLYLPMLQSVVQRRQSNHSQGTSMAAAGTNAANARKGKEETMRPIVQANIEIEQDDPGVMKRMEYLAKYLESGDGLNIRAGNRVIKTKVTKIESVEQ